MDTVKQPVALTFAWLENGEPVRRETITQDIVKIGKDPKSHVRVDDELAARMHAVVEAGGVDDIVLIDLGNEPGTLVNGQRVNKCRLRVGDQIQVGSTVLVLEEVVSAAAAASPAPPEASVSAPAEDAPADQAAPAPEAPAARVPFAGTLAFGQSVPPPMASASAPALPQVAAPSPAPSVPRSGDQLTAAHGDESYELLKSGPPVSPAEIEDPELHSAQVSIRWGNTKLFAVQLAPVRTFVVGETTDPRIQSDSSFHRPSQTAPEWRS